MTAVRRILGIDPGTRYCGYGIVDVWPQSRPSYIECGVLQFSSSSTLAERLHQLYEDLKEVIAEFCPTEMALESIFYSKNVQSAFRLGYARGVVLMVSAESRLGIHEYSPNMVKRAVAGHGHANKKEVQRMVSWQCGLKTAPPSDAADALAIALCHAFRFGIASSHARKGF